MKKKKKVLVEYNSNNSGGSWWLTDKNWKDLEKAGWEVKWGGVYFCGSELIFREKPKDAIDCGKGDKCGGHRMFNSWKKMKDEDRWLGCLAKEATKEFNSLKEGIEEWEEITGLNASDDGCNCCGTPHSFSADDEYASGESILEIKHGDLASHSKEELIKMFQEK